MRSDFTTKRSSSSNITMTAPTMTLTENGGATMDYRQRVAKKAIEFKFDAVDCASGNAAPRPPIGPPSRQLTRPSSRSGNSHSFGRKLIDPYGFNQNHNFQHSTVQQQQQQQQYIGSADRAASVYLNSQKHRQGVSPYAQQKSLGTTSSGSRKSSSARAPASSTLTMVPASKTGVNTNILSSAGDSESKAGSTTLTQAIDKVTTTSGGARKPAVNNHAWTLERHINGTAAAAAKQSLQNRQNHLHRPHTATTSNQSQSYQISATSRQTANGAASSSSVSSTHEKRSVRNDMAVSASSKGHENDHIGGHATGPRTSRVSSLQRQTITQQQLHHQQQEDSKEQRGVYETEESKKETKKVHVAKGTTTFQDFDKHIWKHAYANRTRDLLARRKQYAFGDPSAVLEDNNVPSIATSFSKRAIAPSDNNSVKNNVSTSGRSSTSGNVAMQVEVKTLSTPSNSDDRRFFSRSHSAPGENTSSSRPTSSSGSPQSKDSTQKAHADNVPPPQSHFGVPRGFMHAPARHAQRYVNNNGGAAMTSHSRPLSGRPLSGRRGKSTNESITHSNDGGSNDNIDRVFTKRSVRPTSPKVSSQSTKHSQQQDSTSSSIRRGSGSTTSTNNYMRPTSASQRASSSVTATMMMMMKSHNRTRPSTAPLNHADVINKNNKHRGTYRESPSSVRPRTSINSSSRTRSAVSDGVSNTVTSHIHNGQTGQSSGSAGSISGSSSSSMSHLKGYVLGKEIGEGGFCKVRLGVHRLSGAKVAIKVVDKLRLTGPAEKKRMQREVRVMRRLCSGGCNGGKSRENAIDDGDEDVYAKYNPQMGSGSVIRMFDVIDTASKVYIVMEYAPCGSLLDYVRNRKKIGEDEARKFLVQTLVGLKFCHDNMVIHRDMKLENLLLDADLNIKIIDFGLSAIITSGKKLRVHCGSPSYAAPEIVARREYEGPPVDVWSLGVVLFAMTSGYLPFHAKNNDKRELCQKIVKGHFKVPDGMSMELQNLVRRMLTTDPSRRITLSGILDHSWVRKSAQAFARQPFIEVNDSHVSLSSSKLHNSHVTNNNGHISGSRFCLNNGLYRTNYNINGEIDVDYSIIDILVGHGFDADEVVENVIRCECNYITTAYYLFSGKLRKESKKKLKEEEHEQEMHPQTRGRMAFQQSSSSSNGGNHASNNHSSSGIVDRVTELTMSNVDGDMSTCTDVDVDVYHDTGADVDEEIDPVMNMTQDHSTLAPTPPPSRHIEQQRPSSAIRRHRHMNVNSLTQPVPPGAMTYQVHHSAQAAGTVPVVDRNMTSSNQVMFRGAERLRKKELVSNNNVTITVQ